MFQKDGSAASFSSSSILEVRAGTSKIPPEFRQTLFDRAGVDRQKVSDRFVFHKAVRGK